MTKIAELIEIPDRVHQGDFVLRLTEGLRQPRETLRTYVVTPQLAICFDHALSLIRSAVESSSSKGAYLHGSFGSGKSHFMVVLSLLLQGDVGARSIAELAEVVARHSDWTAGRKFLVVPYHMIGATSMESAILGHYAEYVRRLHPAAPTPGFYRADSLLEDARRMRERLGDEAFFRQLSREADGGGDGGWGSIDAGWDATSFEAAMQAPPRAEERARLVSDLVDTYFTSMRGLAAGGEESFVPLDEGLVVMSRHARDLGYDALVLFLDELILWLASHAADLEFVNREGQKVAKLVEAMEADRAIPIVSFIARQRDLRELVGDHLPGAQQLGFADVLDWWEARFDEITLEDRNLPAIVERRLLRPRSEAARRQIDEAFARTARVREEVLGTLLTREGDREMFRKVYPFSPALVQTLVAVSSLLQRERTALKLMLQLLVDQRHRLALGDLVPVGDLFDVIEGGDEPFTQAMRMRFDHARKLYRQKLLPLLESQHGVRAEDVAAGAVATDKAEAFRNDDRLVKTLILAALAEGVEVLRGLTPARLAALNHGTVRTPIPGQESQIVLAKCRQWAAQVGELKVADEGANPLISLHIVGVDTETILENAKVFDNHGNRIQKIRSILYEQIGIESEGDDLLPPRHEIPWRGSRRTVEILFRNVREMPLDLLKAEEDTWRVVIDFPFDQSPYTPRDDHARVQEFLDCGNVSDTVVWLPAFLAPSGLEDLGRMVVLDHVLSGNRLAEYGAHLSEVDREQARALLVNQRDQMRQRVRNHLLLAYGVSSVGSNAVDHSHGLEEHFFSLNPGFRPRPPVGAGFRDSLEHVVRQALDHQFPDHPHFDGDVRVPALRRTLDIVRRAAQARDGRVEVERALRDEVRRIAVPLQLGAMGETHFVLGNEWRSALERKRMQANAQEFTVRQLREWIERPERRGLAREVQNLVIHTFALQTDRSFYLHGGPVDPGLDDLTDQMELREQTLPAEDHWEVAVERAGHLFGVAVSPLRSAANVDRLAREVTAIAAERAEAVQRLRAQLECHLPQLGGSGEDAPRARTVQATAALLTALRAAEGNAVVDRLAAARMETTETAMGHCIKNAVAISEAVAATEWGLLEAIRELGDAFHARAEAVIGRVREALEHDEHVTALAPALGQAQREALELLREAARGPQPPPVLRGRKVLKQGRKKVTGARAEEVTRTIAEDARQAPDATLEVEWRLYTEE